MFQPFQNSSSVPDTPSFAPDFFNPFSSPASICTNTTLMQKCDSITVGGLVILAPELLPCCLMALILGLTFAHKTLQSKAKNCLFHAITFAMIGVMMTDAGFVDCIMSNLIPNEPLLEFYYGVLDVGLTSTIGFTFLINGLLDAGILKENSPSTWIIFGVGTLAIFIAWTLEFLKATALGYLLLYSGIVGIGCGTWTLIQLKLVYEEKDWKSLKWLVLAGVNGGFGFYAIMSARMIVWLCEHVSCHLGSSFFWFLVTDTAMYFIYRYYKSRAKLQKKRSLIKGEGVSLSYI